MDQKRPNRPQNLKAITKALIGDDVYCHYRRNFCQRDRHNHWEDRKHIRNKKIIAGMTDVYLQPKKSEKSPLSSTSFENKTSISLISDTFEILDDSDGTNETNESSRTYSPMNSYPPFMAKLNHSYSETGLPIITEINPKIFVEETKEKGEVQIEHLLNSREHLTQYLVKNETSKSSEEYSNDCSNDCSCDRSEDDSECCLNDCSTCSTYSNDCSNDCSTDCSTCSEESGCN